MLAILSVAQTSPLCPTRNVTDPIVDVVAVGPPLPVPHTLPLQITHQTKLWKPNWIDTKFRCTKVLSFVVKKKIVLYLIR